LLYDEQIFDLLVAIAHNADSSEFSPWNMVVLDIFHLIFRSIKPQQLMVVPGKNDEDGLKDLLTQEGKQRSGGGYLRAGSFGLSAPRTGQATRHSRFGTTLVMKAVSGARYKLGSPYER
jgi:replication fork protection complex subunit Tof1/Swi1